MEKNTLLVIVVAVLVVFAAVQAVELTLLKDKISSGEFRTGTASTTIAVASGAGTASNPSAGATDINQLSGMVGGC